MSRARRSDRNVVIYQITLKPTGQRYIGKTVAKKRAYRRSTKERFSKHVSDAKNGSDLTLHEAIRKFGEKSFMVELLEVVRGNEAATKRENELIKTLDPNWDLNITGLQKKGRRLDVGTFDSVGAGVLVA